MKTSEAFRIVGVCLAAAILSLFGAGICIACAALYAAIMPGYQIRTGLQIVIGVNLLMVVAGITVFLRERENWSRIAIPLLLAPMVWYATTYYTLRYFELGLWLIGWMTTFLILLLQEPEPTES